MSIPLSIAARLEMIQELLSDTWEDEDGVKHAREPLITKEQALNILKLWETPNELR